MTTQEKIREIRRRMNIATMGCETLAEIERIEAPYRAEIRRLLARE